MTSSLVTVFIIFMLFKKKTTTSIQISSCDNLCVTGSLRSDVDGTYNFLYFNTTLNGTVYYNAVNEKYLHPYVDSDCVYSYVMQSSSSIGTGSSSSHCDIDNPSSGYMFDPADCFNGWRTSDNDEWVDNPSQRVVNCNSISVSGNDKSWLDGTYVWWKFNLQKNSSIYYCKDCGSKGYYLYAWPDWSYWFISSNYSSHRRWSICKYSSTSLQGLITVDDCDTWWTWNGSADVLETDMTVTTHTCPLNIDAGSINGPNCTSNSPTPIDNSDTDDDSSYMLLGSSLSGVIMLCLAYIRRKRVLDVDEKSVTFLMVFLNSLICILFIIVAADDCCWYYSGSLPFFVTFTPTAEWITLLCMEYVWYQHLQGVGIKNFRNSGWRNSCFAVPMLTICILSVGTFTASHMVGATNVGWMMFFYFIITLFLGVLMIMDWHKLKLKKNMKQLQQPLIQLQYDDYKMQAPIHTKKSFADEIACPYFHVALKILREHFPSVPPELFDENGNKCFCETCHNNRNDKLIYERGNPPKKYGIPVGFARFGLKVDTGFCEIHNVFNEWHSGYHGTTKENVADIFIGRLTLLKPGDTAIGGTKLGIRGGHILKPFERYNKYSKKTEIFNPHQIYITPSIKYASHQVYAKSFICKHPMTNTNISVQFVFQLKIRPESYGVGQETVGATKKNLILDEHFSNDEIEWYTAESIGIVLQGLLLRFEHK